MHHAFMQLSISQTKSTQIFFKVTRRVVPWCLFILHIFFVFVFVYLSMSSLHVLRPRAGMHLCPWHLPQYLSGVCV